jgi:hypothetical protein
MRGVISLAPWLLAVCSLVIFSLVAVVSRLALRRWLDGYGDGVAAVAGPLMPALGAIFALLSALALSNEAGQLRVADEDVATEAAAASRLAWASTVPGVATSRVQRSLDTYLRSTRANEWDGGDGSGDPATFRAVRELERTVRAEAAGKELGSAQAGELLGALDTVTSSRRQRLSARAHRLPEPYLLVVVASGLALVVNSTALALDHHRRAASMISGLVVVVALTSALLLALTAPFLGGFVADGGPLDVVTADLRAGVFAR